MLSFVSLKLIGTAKERGIAAWHSASEESETGNDSNVEYEEGVEIYELPLPDRVKQWRGWRFVPFMPNPAKGQRAERSKSLSSDWSRRKSYVVSIPDGMA